MHLQTSLEISKEEDFARILQLEEEYIQRVCEEIIQLKPDLVITEKGVSGELPSWGLFQVLSSQVTVL